MNYYYCQVYIEGILEKRPNLQYLILLRSMRFIITTILVGIGIDSLI